MKIDLIAPPSLQAKRLQSHYLSLLKKTLDVVRQTKPIHVDVMITTNTVIQRYNLAHRGKDYPTDVLSFPLEATFIDPEDHHLHLGQLVISYQKARQQAKAYGHSYNRELSFLFVHGLLHLLGYDHQTKAEENEMIALQDQILGKREIDE